MPAHPSAPYIGRLAPTPTGFIHLGHAATFHTVWQRARHHDGTLLLRIEDLDQARCKPEFIQGIQDDLHWLGLHWQGEPIFQSQRRDFYLRAWKTLRDHGWIYPCRHSRKEVAAQAILAPHDEEPVFPQKWRGSTDEAGDWDDPHGVNWRFRVPDGEEITFIDGRCGRVSRVAQLDFGDFLIWNLHDVPAYELAVVVDDIAQGVTEIVRGEDLLTSTARQLLLYRALSAPAPSFYHTPLLLDEQGRRLAKRQDSKSIRTLRQEGLSPTDVLALAQSARQQSQARASTAS